MRRSLGRRQEEWAARILLALAEHGRRLEPSGDVTDRYELRPRDDKTPQVVADRALVDMMLANDWLVSVGAAQIASQAGLAWLRRQKSHDDPWRGQHLATDRIEVELPGGGRAPATVATNESPLAWLRRRRGADGRPLVTETQFVAGERLRADFERGRLNPRVTADWTRPSAGKRRRCGGGGPADVTDAALDARERVEVVLRALGPDLGALLLDVCCFLTGLEDAERKRAWPRRSAKVVLGIALDRLAAHYGLSETARGADRARKILHWGDEDYRPRAGAAADSSVN
ncbi:DUF6456 domain-containing protein [Microbaculum sp. FT89]|uniref:DUF6456 domain-containing protein n=1 Tax=Microbaculum sp. FT89 TaxID=3447298 RepID=UPI003F52C2D0